MVIYLQNKFKVIMYYIVVFICVVFSYIMSNFFCYFRLDDRDYIDNYLLELQNIELSKQNEELNKFLNVNLDNYEYVIGKVKYRDMYNFYEEIIIDVPGISVGDAVISSEGLVGIVVNEVGKVKLLTSTYNVSVLIGECNGNLSNGKVTMVDKVCKIDINDKVYTSGLGGVLGGIYVGDVVDIIDDNLGYVLDINLVDNKGLNYVGVIK